MTLENRKINAEALENVNGGYVVFDPGCFWSSYFIFFDQEAEVLNKALNTSVESRHLYTRGELNDMGIKGSTKNKMIATLSCYGLSPTILL